MAGVVAVPVSAEKKRAKVEKGFVALFDGTATDQWMNARSGKFPGKGWAIEGDCLKHAAKGGGGDIITRSTYEQFDFRFEWKVAKGANSGVKYFIIRERGSLGHEYQVIDDINHSDGVRGNHQTASPWSCNRMCPANLTPNFSSFLNLLLATAAFTSSLPSS